MCANARLTVIRPRAPESRGAADSRRSSVREGGIDGVLFTPAPSEDRKARRLEAVTPADQQHRAVPGLSVMLIPLQTHIDSAHVR